MWFDRIPGDYGPHEVLFVSFMLLLSGAQVDAWVGQVLPEQARFAQLGSAWAALNRSAWESVRQEKSESYAPVHVPLRDVCAQRAWPKEQLEQIGRAMKVASSLWCA